VKMNVAVTVEDTNPSVNNPLMPSLSCHQWEALIPSVDLCFAGAEAAFTGGTLCRRQVQMCRFLYPSIGCADWTQVQWDNDAWTRTRSRSRQVTP